MPTTRRRFLAALGAVAAVPAAVALKPLLPAPAATSTKFEALESGYAIQQLHQQIQNKMISREDFERLLNDRFPLRRASYREVDPMNVAFATDADGLTEVVERWDPGQHTILVGDQVEMNLTIDGHDYSVFDVSGFDYEHFGPSLAQLEQRTRWRREYTRLLAAELERNGWRTHEDP